MKNATRNGRENDLPTESAKRSRLAERPERRGGRRVSALLLVLCGCLIILGGGGVLAWQLSSHANAPAVSTSTPASSNSPVKQAAGCTGAREPVDIIMQQTAQGLHLSVAQVQARVLAGKTVAQIATEQGLTPTQLHDVEVQALHYANNRWKNMGCISQQDVQDNLQRDTGTAAYMDAEFTAWFRG
jgi:cytoskeletal protein RodZ